MTYATNRELQQRFRHFNQLYFGGRLPGYRVRLTAHGMVGKMGRTYRSRKEIAIKAGIDIEEAISVLLHEMAHVATNDWHGNRWQTEIRRLWDCGAPLLQDHSPEAFRSPTTDERK